MRNCRILAIIQARMGSTRLPGKVLKVAHGRPLLAYLLERVARAKSIDGIVVATTTEQADDSISLFCQELGFWVFRGSMDDVLERYYLAARQYKAEVVVRLTADCPLIDPKIVDLCVARFLELPENSFVTNSPTYEQERTFPRGMDVEVFSFASLAHAQREAHCAQEREHVTTYFRRHREQFPPVLLSYSRDLSKLRLTVDEPKDFELISLVLSELLIKNPNFTLQDIEELFVTHTNWVNINASVRHKTLLYEE